jgi:ribosomal protein S11
MTKRTPLRELRVALQAFGKAKEAAIGRVRSDAEKVRRIETDRSLTPQQRLETLKSLQMWPRIMLGIY